MAKFFSRKKTTVLLSPLLLYRSQEPPRVVTFVVSDELGSQSNTAMATINFESVDNPPILDLNGPLQPGTNFMTLFTEGGMPIPVRKFQLQNFLILWCSAY